jgi:hypothetical protein
VALSTQDIRTLLVKKFPPKNQAEQVWASVLLALSERLDHLAGITAKVVEIVQMHDKAITESPTLPATAVGEDDGTVGRSTAPQVVTVGAVKPGAGNGAIPGAAVNPIQDATPFPAGFTASGPLPGAGAAPVVVPNVSGGVVSRPQPIPAAAQGKK